MSKIINVVPNDDFTMLIELEQGNKVIFNMQRMVKTMPYYSLSNLENFKKLYFEEKAVCWTPSSGATLSVCHLRITLDNILFMLRD
jgi:hypothetical protein